MAMTEESMVIGVFRDHALAEKAIDELRHAGFRNDQINLLGHTSGNALGGIMNLFSRKSDTPPDTVAAAPNELASAGIAQEDMPFYQRELEAGNFVVTVQPYGHAKEASDILYRHGAYDASADTTRMGGGSRVVPIREERLNVSKQVVQTGEVIITKRVITENKTFTVPVTREEVTIERVPSQQSRSDVTTNTGTTANAGMAGNITHPDTYSNTSDVTTTNAGMAGNVTPPDTHSNTSDVTANNVTTANAGVVGNTMSPDTHGNTSDAAALHVVDGGELLKNGGIIRILVREEQVILNKQTVVVEEIVVRKQQVQETQQISDTVKHEEVRVEHTGNIIIHDNGANVTQ